MDDISCLKDVKAGGDISECIIKEHLTLSELFHKVGLSSSEIALALTKDAFQFALYDRKSDLHVKLYPTADTDVDNQAEAINIIADDSKLGRAFGVGNGIGAFVNEAVTKQPVFFDILAKGTTYKWISHSPINFINLQYDSVVARANYDDAYNYMLTSSPGMIASTLIPNFQLTNVIDQYKPLLKSAVSHFWAPIDAIAETIVPNVDSAVMAQPNDHGSPITFNLSNVIASCVFTNWLASNGSANQALCPN